MSNDVQEITRCWCFHSSRSAHTSIKSSSSTVPYPNINRDSQYLTLPYISVVANGLSGLIGLPPSPFILAYVFQRSCSCLLFLLCKIPFQFSFRLICLCMTFLEYTQLSKVNHSIKPTSAALAAARLASSGSLLDLPPNVWP